jgi:type IV pilus assembly protein PilO
MKFGIREIIFVALMLGLLGGTYLFVFSKTNSKREALVKDMAQKRKMLNDLHAATAGIEDMNAKIDDLTKAIKFFEGKLPQEKDVGDILQQIWDMAKLNNLQSRTVKPDNNNKQQDQGAAYCELPIQVSLSGDFNGFYAFLLQLEKLQRITRVTQLKLEKIDEHDGEATASMTLSIFFEPQRASSSVATAN